VIIDSRATDHVIDFSKCVAYRAISAVNAIGSEKIKKTPAKR
jgi:hypothetical protein